MSDWEAKGSNVFQGDDCIGICDTDNASADEMEARARLMAAAPDLLAAVNGCLAPLEQDIQDIGPCDHDVNLCVCGLKNLVAQCRAALSKATGEA